MVTAAIFLLVTTACSHSPKKPPTPSPYGEISSQEEIARSLSTSESSDPWWKKEENQYLFMVFIILGVAVAASAAIYYSFNSSGLSISVRK